MINSPWAMLITPINPKANASPNDTINKMEPRLTPLKNCTINASMTCVPLFLVCALSAPRPAIFSLR